MALAGHGPQSTEYLEELKKKKKEKNNLSTESFSLLNFAKKIAYTSSWNNGLFIILNSHELIIQKLTYYE